MTKRTSTSYVCTLDANSVADMQMLEMIRKTVSVSNANTLDKKRVVVRGRKPIKKFWYKEYWSKKSHYSGYDYAGNIIGGLENATNLDVYIYDRRN